MEHPSITRLREIAATPSDPRNTHEWPMPVKPSDLRILFERYDVLLAKSTETIKPGVSAFDMFILEDDVTGGFYTD
jgi:hypothetical protein